VYDGRTVETTWSGGGGGVSVVFSKPSYQTGFTSTTGRSTPDVSLVADPNTGVLFTIGGQQQVVGVTSIVSPAIAAYAAILQTNQFLTPLLYTAPASNFHDILSGSNGSYSATTGYDTTTGLGSIVGMQLANSLQQNPAVPVTGISLPASVSVDIGTPTTLAATFQPTTATN
jgi:kumamolisin